MSFVDKDKNREYQRDWAKNNRDKLNKQTAMLRERNRNYVRYIKENSPCVDCGEFYHPFVMDFDHVKGDKVADISRLINQRKSIKCIQEEIDKCELVCANCHRMRTFNRLINIK